MCLNEFLIFHKAPSLVRQMIEYSKDSLEHPVYHPEGTLYNHIEIVLSRTLEDKKNRDLHFVALLHDICKHGNLKCLGIDKQVGELKVHEKGSYWQNIDHADQALEFIKLPQITKWLKYKNVDIEKVSIIVGNHMKMKSYLMGEDGNPNGMRESGRNTMKAQFSHIWDDMYLFSSYCDSMLKPTRKK